VSQSLGSLMRGVDVAFSTKQRVRVIRVKRTGPCYGQVRQNHPEAGGRRWSPAGHPQAPGRVWETSICAGSTPRAEHGVDEFVRRGSACRPLPRSMIVSKADLTGCF